MTLLDQMESQWDARRSLQDSDEDNWAPQDRYGVPMRLGISGGDNFIPIVQSEADWDRATVEREDVFLHRFGFAWPHPHRKAPIALKHERGLTDPEIRRLYGTGNVRRQGSGVRFVASLFMAITGCTMIAILLLPMTLVVLRTLMSLPLLTWKQAFELAILVMVLLMIQEVHTGSTSSLGEFTGDRPDLHQKSFAASDCESPAS